MSSSGAASAGRPSQLTTLCDRYITAATEVAKLAGDADSSDSSAPEGLNDVSSIWRLVKALWSPEQGAISVPNSSSLPQPAAPGSRAASAPGALPLDYAELYARRRALERWLADTVRGEVARDVSAAGSSASSAAAAGGSAAARAILALLTGNQVVEACEEAASAGDLRLATLLAQAGEDTSAQSDLAAQLKKWKASGMFDLFDQDHQ